MSLLPDRPVTPTGSARWVRPSIVEAGDAACGPVWVLDDAGAADGDGALAVADRLGVAVRRVPLLWGARARLAAVTRSGTLYGLLSRLPLSAGSPALTLSGGARAARVAAWLARHAGSRMVHIGPARLATGLVDLHVVNDEGAGADATAGVLPVLGPLHAVSPMVLARVRAAWRERLGHLPHPRLALLVGSGLFGGEMQPAEAFRVGQSLAAAVSGAGGAILAVTEAGTGREAADALAASLDECLHLLHRAGDPDADTPRGFMASADVIVVAGQSPRHLVQACASTVPVYVMQTGGVSPPLRRLHQRLIAAGQIRELDGRIQAWKRAPLDEAGRVAAAIEAGGLGDGRRVPVAALGDARAREG